jgi:hypothetical protein
MFNENTSPHIQIINLIKFELFECSGIGDVVKML